VNSAFAQPFGYEQSELLRAHWGVLYHDREAKRLERRILPAVLQTGYWAGETVRMTKQGERLVTDHRLTSAGEDIIVCTAKDLTEERAASGTAGKTYELLLDTIGQEGYVCFTFDHEGYITRWSNGAERLYGCNADDVPGELLSTVFNGSDRDVNAAQDLLDTARSEGSITQDGPPGREDGSQVRAQLRISASHDSDGTLRGFGVVTHAAPEQPTEQHGRDGPVGET
jgi:PAS domain S-box-containing protein